MFCGETNYLAQWIVFCSFLLEKKLHLISASFAPNRNADIFTDLTLDPIRTNLQCENDKENAGNQWSNISVPLISGSRRQTSQYPTVSKGTFINLVEATWIGRFNWIWKIYFSPREWFHYDQVWNWPFQSNKYFNINALTSFYFFNVIATPVRRPFRT